MTVVREHLLPNGAWRDNPFLARSAGACPPRSPACPNDCSSGSPDPERIMARRNPSGPVARGPVPRDRSTRAKNARQPTVSLPTAARRGTGPRPTVSSTFFYRSAGACPPRSFDLREKRTQAKVISRSDRGPARDRPSPYGERETINVRNFVDNIFADVINFLKIKKIRSFQCLI